MELLGKRQSIKQELSLHYSMKQSIYILNSVGLMVLLQNKHKKEQSGSSIIQNRLYARE